MFFGIRIGPYGDPGLPGVPRARASGNGRMWKPILIAVIILNLTACAGPLRPSGSVTVGPYGGAVSGSISGPGGSATVTVPMK